MSTDFLTDTQQPRPITPLSAPGRSQKTSRSSSLSSMPDLASLSLGEPPTTPGGTRLAAAAPALAADNDVFADLQSTVTESGSRASLRSTDLDEPAEPAPSATSSNLGSLPENTQIHVNAEDPPEPNEAAQAPQNARPARHRASGGGPTTASVGAGHAVGPYGGPGAAPHGVLVRVPDEHVGRVIGKNGVHIRELQLMTGARVYLPKSGAPGAAFREMLVAGTGEQIRACQDLLQNMMRAPGQPPALLHISPAPYACPPPPPPPSQPTLQQQQQQQQQHQMMLLQQQRTHPAAVPPAYMHDAYGMGGGFEVPPFYPGGSGGGGGGVPLLYAPPHFYPAPVPVPVPVATGGPPGPKVGSPAAHQQTQQQHQQQQQHSPPPPPLPQQRSPQPAAAASNTPRAVLTISPVAGGSAVMLPEHLVDFLIASGTIHRLQDTTGTRLELSAALPAGTLPGVTLRALYVFGAAHNVATCCGQLAEALYGR